MQAPSARHASRFPSGRNGRSVARTGHDLGQGEYRVGRETRCTPRVDASSSSWQREREHEYDQVVVFGGAEDVEVVWNDHVGRAEAGRLGRGQGASVSAERAPRQPQPPEWRRAERWSRRDRVSDCSSCVSDSGFATDDRFDGGAVADPVCSGAVSLGGNGYGPRSRPAVSTCA